MTRSSSKKTDSFIFVEPEDDWDMVCLIGLRLNEEFYPASRICYIGLSDGTLFRYDGENAKKKLSVVRKGPAYKGEAIKKGVKSPSFKIDEDKVDWVICGERS